ncbi:MAG: DNA primase [Clostridia bacterium]|nr:DNA primase [Clostridia bacterium]
MAGFFPQAWLDELRARTDLVSIASEYIPLTQKGRRYWGCCPFHQEKTGSFSIDSEKQMYYCFGCKASGNVYNFVMASEKLDFVGAVKYLAEKYNVALPQNEEDERRYRQQKKQQERMYEIMTSAARFFRDRLFAPEGEQARAYLKKRGMTGDMVRKFGIGYAPDSWNALKDKLLSEGVTEQEAKSLGLLSKSKGRTYDAFRNRVMFPIFDERGRVVAFGGRVLDNSLPKYINSPDTPVFNKRKQLYGLHLLKKERDLKYAIVTEGYMDVISMWQAGIPGAMATMGTAMTADQARMLRRYVPRVILLYDGDAAGQNASLRGMDILTSQGLEVRVASLPDNLDPDEMIKRRGAMAMRDQLDRAMPLIGFRLMLEKKKWDLSNTEQRTRYAMAAAAIISELESPIQRESYLKTLQVETGFSMQALLAQVQGKKDAVQTNKNDSPTQAATVEMPEVSADVRAQRELVRTLLQTPANLWPKEAAQLQSEDFTCPMCRMALGLLQEARQSGTRLEVADVYTRLAAQGDSTLAGILTAELPEGEAPPEQMLREWIVRRIRERDKRRVQQLKQQLMSPDTSDEEKMKLMVEIQKIQTSMRELHT